MLEDLTIIDMFERIRASMLNGRAPFEREWGQLRQRDYAAQPPDAIRETLLATLLDVNLAEAAGRRRARLALQALDGDEPLAQTLRSLLGASEAQARALMVRENTPLAEIDPLREALRRFEALCGEAGLPPLLQKWGDPTTAVARLTAAIPGLRGLKAYRFLQGIGYPILMPDVSRRRLLFRLGLWSHPPDCRDHLAEYQETGGAIARLTGEAVLVIDAMLALFSGAGRRRPDYAPCCLPNRPLCDQCPVQPLCAYHRYTGSQPQPDATHMRNLRQENRPREKFERLGPDGLSDAELLAILLRTGSENQSALTVATGLLKRFESLDGVDRATLGDLLEVRGIGPGKAVEIQAAFALGRRLLGRPLARGDAITCGDDVFHRYQMRFHGKDQEECLLLCLDTKKKVIKETRVSIGTLDQSLVHPRDVFKEAIRVSAHSVLFLHNHPSGDPRPSEADMALTRRLVQAGEMLHIRILDHIIIGDETYYSFLDAGQMG